MQSKAENKSALSGFNMRKVHCSSFPSAILCHQLAESVGFQFKLGATAALWFDFTHHS